MIRVLGFIDYRRLAAWAYRKDVRPLLTGGADGRHVILARNGEWQHPELDKWATLKASINRACQIAEAGNLELVRAEIEELDPGAGLPWRRCDEVTVRVGVTWNPADYLLYPPAQHTLLPGQVVAIPPGMQSAINLGDSSRAHLVLTLRQRVADENG